jgi:CBS domain containing-hemolysin-like protein
VILLPLLLFLLACLAVYLGVVESAFNAELRLSLRLVAEREGRDDELGRFLDDPARLLLPLRILGAFVAALAAIGIGGLAARLGATAPVVSIAGVAIFILVCQHLVPAALVRGRSARLLELLLPSFAVLVGPVAVMLASTASARRERPGPVSPESAAEGEPAAPAAVAPAAEPAGLTDGDERRLIQSIFDFGDTLVREVMTPRPDLVAIRATATLDELRALFREQEYSRIPVYKDHLDNIVGFVFVKDLIQLGDAPGQARPIDTLLRPAYFVPETKRVADLLREFQQNQVQSAIVVDEYGGTAGLVTLEDLIEEIVGEIRDEYDVEAEPVVDEGQGSYLFSGKADIHELVDRLDVAIEREGFETVGGYLLSHLGRVPAVGESFEIDHLSIEVLEVERRRISKVRIRRASAASHAQA